MTAPVIKKIPGKPVRFTAEKDGFVNLSAMSKLELVDLLERENKLLNSKNFISKLPDKGEKIRNFHSKVVAELKKREEHDKLCNLISDLSVNDSKEALNKLEWTRDCHSTGDYETKRVDEDKVVNNSDPLQILATHSGTSVSNKKILHVKKSDPLSKPSNASGNNAIELDVDLYAQHLCRLIDKNKGEKSEKFYPNKSLNKTFTKTTSKTREPEISSAYVPKNISGQTKLLSLEESILVHQELLKHIKEIETNNAVERLLKKVPIKTKLPKSFTTSYREPQPEDSDDEDSYTSEENSDEECDDEEKISNLSDVD